MCLLTHSHTHVQNIIEYRIKITFPLTTHHFREYISKFLSYLGRETLEITLLIPTIWVVGGVHRKFKQCWQYANSQLKDFWCVFFHIFFNITKYKKLTNALMLNSLCQLLPIWTPDSVLHKWIKNYNAIGNLKQHPLISFQQPQYH